MALRKEDRELLAHWLTRQKQALRTRDDALEDGKRWFRRAKLASEKGEMALAQQAHQRAVQAKASYDKAVAELERIAQELDVLRSQKATISDGGAAARLAQIAENFEALGIDTDAAAFDVLEEQSKADQALNRLQRSLTSSEPEKPSRAERAQSPIPVENEGRSLQKRDADEDIPASGEGQPGDARLSAEDAASSPSARERSRALDSGVNGNGSEDPESEFGFESIGDDDA